MANPAYGGVGTEVTPASLKGEVALGTKRFAVAAMLSAVDPRMAGRIRRTPVYRQQPPTTAAAAATPVAAGRAAKGLGRRVFACPGAG